MWNTTHYAVHIFEWGVLLVKPLVLEQEIPRGELHGMWYNAPTMLPAGGRFIPPALRGKTTVLTENESG